MTPLESVLAALAKSGLLFKQDKAIPSVVGILTGESLRSSWWSHPKAQLIFGVLAELADHQDVLLTKLLHHKDTFVHRSLWPALLAVGSSREPWQLRGLSVAAKGLLERIDRSQGSIRASGGAVKELEVRLLAPAYEIHTESGRHETVIEAWSAWSARVGCAAISSVPQARSMLEQAATKLGAPPHALPWSARGAAT